MFFYYEIVSINLMTPVDLISFNYRITPVDLEGFLGSNVLASMAWIGLTSRHGIWKLWGGKKGNWHDRQTLRWDWDHGQEHKLPQDPHVKGWPKGKRECSQNITPQHNDRTFTLTSLEKLSHNPCQVHQNSKHVIPKWFMIRSNSLSFKKKLYWTEHVL